jgi:PhnB protein
LSMTEFQGATVMQVQPYLFFDGRCEEALAFYKKTLGATVEMMMRWKDGPDKAMCTPGSEDKVMHAAFKIGDTAIMGSDGRNSGQPKFDGFALSLDAKSDDEAKSLFAALSDGGEVAMPLGPTFFATSFGMLRDRFGVHWMVIKPK